MICFYLYIYVFVFLKKAEQCVLRGDKILQINVYKHWGQDNKPKRTRYNVSLGVKRYKSHQLCCSQIDFSVFLITNRVVLSLST